MAKKKPDPKKKKRTAKKSPLRSELKKAIVGLAILLSLVLLAGVLTYYLILRGPSPSVQPAQPALPTEQSPAPKPGAYKPPDREVDRPPAYEIFPIDKPPMPKVTPPISPSKDLPRVAIIIDDLGYQKKLSDAFLGLDAVLTFSLLPHSPFQEYIANFAHEKGAEVMLHLPMEPHEYPAIDGGPGMLLTEMAPDQLIDQLIKNLDAVPHIRGVNSHMGSKMTERSDQMRQIFIILKKRGLFFIDSLTTSASISKPSAHLLQIPFGQRDVFIDHFQEPDFIREQIALLIRIAQARGQAIGIAHPHQVTYDILLDMLPRLKKEVKLVPASQLVRIIS